MVAPTVIDLTITQSNMMRSNRQQNMCFQHTHKTKKKTTTTNYIFSLGHIS